ncbi:MAG: TIGR03617 family F420-dependent LLM class oxidoreductase [Solirubrobacteraceae bacterium]
MELELMVSGASWQQVAELARSAEAAGVRGLVFTEIGATPWMSLAAAATATTTLRLSTGVAVAFARSPMTTASAAWELAGNSKGRFRLGLGSQVRAHVERRYGAAFSPPGPRLRDYVEAVRACLRAFRGEAPLDHQGPYYRLSLLPAAWAPQPHAYGDIPIDVAAVNTWMCRMAGEVADGVHVHPLHSTHYLHQRLLPAIREGAALSGRRPSDVELTIPVFAVAGDTAEGRAAALARARQQIAFYGSTQAYSFQFEDLGFPGTSAALNGRLKAGDLEGMASVVTDEMLEHFTVVATWDGMADSLAARYEGIARRLVMYLAAEQVREDPPALLRWGEVAKALAPT